MAAVLTTNSTVDEVYEYFKSVGLEHVAESFKGEFLHWFIDLLFAVKISVPLIS